MDRMEINQLVLAALLHDIGKFAQRAGRPRSKDEGELCPQDTQHRRPTHLHVLYTDYFIENDLPLPFELEGRRAHIARLAAAHHKPGESVLQEKCIAIADRLSAGGDRLTEDSGDEGDYKSARLACVFQQISLKTSIDEEKRSYYPLAPLGSDIFSLSLQEARRTGYGELFDAFRDALSRIPCDNGVDHYVSSLVSLLEQYTWCIPSSTWHTRPDISLYDHAVTTAAIAQALFVFHKEEGGFPGEGISSPKVLLFGGDLSGIQRYIFHLDNAHGSGVAKLFRARSFHLQLMSRSVALALQREFGLNSVARVMDAGGRFLLLLPATKSVRRRLPEFEAEVQRWFYQRFKGELNLNLSYSVELSENDFRIEKFQKKLAEFNDHLELRKLKKFDLILQDDNMPVHALDYEQYAEAGECNVCKSQPASLESADQFQQQFQREVSICDACFKMIDIVGRKLPEAQFVSIATGENGTELFGGLSYRLHKKNPPHDAVEIINIRNHDEYTYLPIAGYLPHISQQDVVRWQKQGLLLERDGQMFHGDDIVEQDKPKTLNLLAHEARIHVTDGGGFRGKAFLGAFKADVDNLGMLFSIGLQSRLSISRFACMSRMLNTFFADYLVRRIRESTPNIYVVFAGGDDLFLLGPWTECIAFAELLDEEFRSFVAHNPDITLSAGVALAKSGLPVRTLAHESETLLDASKERKTDVGALAKDAITVFGVTVSWADFHLLLEKGTWLEQLLLENKITQGLAYRLLQYGDDYKAFKDGDIQKGLCLSHMKYDFARNVNDRNLSEQEKSDVYGMQQDEMLLRNLRLPVSYAFYRLRT